jgi:hypothetical protein
VSHFDNVEPMTGDELLELRERIERELPRPDFVRDNHVLNGWIDEWNRCAKDRDRLLKTINFIRAMMPGGDPNMPDSSFWEYDPIKTTRRIMDRYYR